MSFILEALKKAEQDRHAGQAPVLDDVLSRPARAAPRPAPTQPRAWSLLAVAMALMMLVAGLVYWPKPLATKPAQPVASSPAVIPMVAESPEAAAPVLRVDPARLEPALPADPVTASPVVTMDDLDTEVVPAPAPASNKSRAEAALPAPAAAPAEAVTTPTPPAAEASATEPTLAPPALTPAPAAATVEPAVRALRDMPAAFRSEFPKLTVDVHVYDSNPLRRFVILNGKKYRETDTMLEGPRIIEITADGVIVEQRGSKVLLELPR